MRLSPVLFALVVFAVSVSGCAWFDYTRMKPGRDCLECHVANGKAAKHVFTLAGTVFESASASPGDGVAADITVTDLNNKIVKLKSNESGNFFTAAPLAFPVTVSVTRGGKPAQMKAPSGACNSCHTQPPKEKAPGRIFVAP